MQADIEADFLIDDELLTQKKMYEDSFLIGGESNQIDLAKSIQILQERVNETKKQHTGQTIDDEERVGTPFYLAPELWRNQPCTKASDIWALGVILYELCNHDYPFPATEEEELKNKVLNQKMDKIRTGVSVEFVVFINKMLKKDAMERPTIEEIIYNDLF